MLVTVHLEQSQYGRLDIQNEMSEEEALAVVSNLNQGVWQTLDFPPGSPDKIVVNPAFVSAVQLVG